MTTDLSSLASILRLLRLGFFAVAAVLAVVCLVDWAVRTRRLNPFGGIARFMRSYVDPLLVPLERRIVRGGGAPSTAPWWALVFVVLTGILVLSLVQFLAGEVLAARLALGSGPRGLALLALSWTFGVLQLALFVRVIASWFALSPWSPWIRWSVSLTDWFLRPLRRIVPPLGAVDISPIVAYLLLVLVHGFLRGLV